MTDPNLDEDKPISYQEIEAHKFTNKRAGVAALLIATAENKPYLIGEDHELGAITLAHSIAKILGVDPLTYIHTPRTHEDKRIGLPEIVATEESVWRTPVTEEELSTEFVHGTRALVQCGILDPDLVLDIEGRLLDYHNIHLTSNPFSG